MSFHKNDLRIFWSMQVLAIVVTVVAIWRALDSDPLAGLCNYYLSQIPDLPELCHRLKIWRIISRVCGLIIFSSGNVAALFVGKLKYFDNLCRYAKFALRLLAATIGIIISVLFLWALDTLFIGSFL